MNTKQEFEEAVDRYGLAEYALGELPVTLENISGLTAEAIESKAALAALLALWPGEAGASPERVAALEEVAEAARFMWEQGPYQVARDRLRDALDALGDAAPRDRVGEGE